MSPTREISALHIEDIISQHAEEAAFLWLLRDQAVRAANYSVKDLAKLDERVEAHLDGLRVAGEVGWKFSEAELRHEEPGEVFAAAVLAFDSSDARRVGRVLDLACPAPPLARALVSALGWVPAERVWSSIEQMLLSDSAEVRRAGVGGAAVHRLDPGPRLAQAVADPDPRVRARALKAAGELGRTDLLGAVAEETSDPDADCRFYAAWSASLLGWRSSSVTGLLSEIAERQAADAVQGSASLMPTRGAIQPEITSRMHPSPDLKRQFGSGNPVPRAEAALAMAVRCMPLQQAKLWCRRLLEQPGKRRLGTLAAGVVGDPEIVGDLIALMEREECSRVAGEAFSTITGAEIALDLSRKNQNVFESRPSDDPADDDVALDPDESLPWPASAFVAKWWEKNRTRFRTGVRYLRGREIAEESLCDALVHGNQRQRAAAASELALLTAGRPLFEVRARGGLQLNVSPSWTP